MLTAESMEAALLSAFGAHRIAGPTMLVVPVWAEGMVLGAMDIERKFSGSNWRRRKREYRKLSLEIRKGMR